MGHHLVYDQLMVRLFHAIQLNPIYHFDNKVLYHAGTLEEMQGSWKN